MTCMFAVPVSYSIIFILMQTNVTASRRARLRTLCRVSPRVFLFIHKAHIIASRLFSRWIRKNWDFFVFFGILYYIYTCPFDRDNWSPNYLTSWFQSWAFTGSSIYTSIKYKIMIGSCVFICNAMQTFKKGKWIKWTRIEVKHLWSYAVNIQQ